MIALTMLYPYKFGVLPKIFSSLSGSATPWQEERQLSETFLAFIFSLSDVSILSPDFLALVWDLVTFQHTLLTNISGFLADWPDLTVGRHKIQIMLEIPLFYQRCFWDLCLISMWLEIEEFSFFFGKKSSKTHWKHWQDYLANFRVAQN